MRVRQRGVDEGCVRDVAFRDLAGAEHHLDVVAGRGVRISIHRDRRIRLVAAAAVDLREGIGQLGGVLDADVLEGAQIGLEVAERRRVGRPEAPALHLRVWSRALDRPGIPARCQVVGDRRGLLLSARSGRRWSPDRRRRAHPGSARQRGASRRASTRTRSRCRSMRSASGQPRGPRSRSRGRRRPPAGIRAPAGSPRAGSRRGRHTACRWSRCP